MSQFCHSSPFGFCRSLTMKTGGRQLQVHRAHLLSNTGSGTMTQINTISVAHVNNRHWSTNKQRYTITIARTRTGLPKVTEWWSHHGGKVCCGSFVCAELTGAWCPGSWLEHESEGVPCVTALYAFSTSRSFTRAHGVTWPIRDFN